MDPEERDELLWQVDDAADDNPKGRALKDAIKTGFARSQRDEADKETPEPDRGG
jgi:hypothetical protein